MTGLQEHFRAVAKEYVRQFGVIAGLEPATWAGPLDGHAALFGTCIVTLEEMAVVVDLLPRWTERHGSKEAVGQEVREWMEREACVDVSLLEDICGDGRHAGSLPYRRIGLFHWLGGLEAEGGSKGCRI